MTVASERQEARREEPGREESVAASGARWITVAFVIVGLLNYAYALMLTRLLDVSAYSGFAAGAGLILWASTVATVSVPWVLAQGMARARSNPERWAAIRFSMLASAGSGFVAALVVGIIATRFGGSRTALVVAVSTFIIFLGTTTTGWLQGQQRMRALSALYVGENVLKNLAGVLLVIVAGLREDGALAAFGIGGIVMLLWWPRVPRGSGRQWLAALANRGMWGRTIRIGGAQGLVSLFVAIDVVLVAVLPGDRALAASYQASAALSRVPLFVAGAVATAFFQSLSRRATGGAIAARAVQMYAAVALPLCVILATTPAALLVVVFPAQYGAMATLLKFTAVTGLAAGGIGLMTAFFQAADDYTCLPWLGAGLAGYVGALLAGWRIDGITGLAAGAALGAVATLVLLGYRLMRREGRGLLRGITLAEPLAAAAVLVLLRPHPVAWLAVAALVGLRAGVRFLRPGARHARPGPRTAPERPGPGPAARRVVISSFDSPGHPHYDGGGAVVVEMIARWLTGQFEVTVVTSGRRGGTVMRDGVCYRQLPVARAGPRAGQLLFHALLPFVARRTPHDLWIESFTPPFSTSFLPLFSRARVVGFAQNLSGEEMSRRYRLPFFLVERFGLRFYRDVVVLNPADRAAIRRHSPAAAVRVIPNCVDLPFLDERRLGRGEYILFLGRIEIETKGLDLLLAAYERSGLAMPLLIAGSGTRREERRLANLLIATGGDVRWLGQVTGEHKQELLERSAFVMLPSRHEAFGLAALEGMSCGKPVVHFDLPTLRWMDGDVRVPPADVGALADEMRDLADDETVRRELGRAAHAAARRFGPDETANRYRALVRQLLDPSGTGTTCQESDPVCQ
jgi:glycosyltransferase involved in cell wall biosynthesis/O-antigen/teichoic acid export membrane protein